MSDNTNPLTGVLPPRARQLAYAVLFVASLIFGLFQAADGDWATFVGSVLAALVGLLAAGNVNTAAAAKSGATSWGRHVDEGGRSTLVLLAAVSTLGMILSVLAVTTASSAQAGATSWGKGQTPPSSTCTKGACSWLTAPGAARAADSLRTKCWTSADGDAHVCLDVYWHGDGDGVGVTVNDVYLRITGGFWENHAVDCDNLRLWNANGVVWWRKDGNECDIEKSPGYTLFHPHIDLNKSEQANFGFTFRPHLDAAPDPGPTHISLQIAV